MMNPFSLELILRDEVCKLLDNFAALMRLQAVFFAADGRILKRGRNYASSDYCRLMQEKFFGIDVCVRLDREKQREAARFGHMLCYTCHAGLREVIAPVVIADQLAGFFMFGQFRTTDVPPDCVRGDAEAVARYRALPFIADENLDNLLDMIKMLTDYIVTREFITLAGDRRMAQIKQYLDRHLTEQVTLGRLARHLACSESGLTHYLHREHGTSFKKLLTEKRIAAAEQLLKDSPELTVAEVAAQVGYRDPHYFSRVFRAVRRESPGLYRARRS
jgi:AraC-like DNA-binding protein